MKKYINRIILELCHVLWSNDSKYNLKSSDRAKKVRRKSKEAYKLSCMIRNVKFGIGNMFWGDMSLRGVGKITFIHNIMNAAIYTDILKKNLKSLARKLRLRNNFIFQLDNDPKHTTKKHKNG